MDRSTAIRNLLSADAKARLEAARYFVTSGAVGDKALLQQALQNEEDHWVRNALTKGINRISSDLILTPETVATSEDVTLDNEMYSRAIREVTGQVVHELRKVLALVMHNAKLECADYEKGKTRGYVETLNRYLDAFDILGRVSKTAVFSEFDLSELIDNIAEAACQEILRKSYLDDLGFSIEMAGLRPCIVKGEKSILEIAFINGFRNAIEALVDPHASREKVEDRAIQETSMADVRELLGASERPLRNGKSIIVTWGVTDIDYWLAILDDGPGPPPDAAESFGIGRTTKPKKYHLGMGLAVAKRAMLSHEGVVFLSRRGDGGARFECRWPIPLSDSIQAKDHESVTQSEN